MSTLTSQEIRALYKRFPGAYTLQILFDNNEWVNVSINHYNNTFTYRLYPILPEGLPWPTQDMIDRAMVYIGTRPKPDWPFEGACLDLAWTTGTWGGGESVHYCIDPRELRTSELFNKYQETLKGETVVAYKTLEVFGESEGKELEYPKLKLNSRGQLILVNTSGQNIGTLTYFQDGELCTSDGCKQVLERNHMATDFAQWEKNGSIKVGS